MAALALVTAPPLQAQSPAAAAVAAPPEAATVFGSLSEAEIARRVDAAIARVRARPEFVGVSVAVARGDRMILDRGYGIADLEWNAPADAGTPFRIGSLTKQFTAAAIMKLVEQGKLSLDDPLARYVPEFDTGGRTVTIRQLLNHTSGLPNYTEQPGFFDRQAPLDLSDKELLALISGKPFTFEPGKGWRYSNTNYYLLGMVVAKVSGRSYPEFVESTLFKPLGLAHTRYGSEGEIVVHRAQGYRFDPDTNARHNDTLISMNTPGGAGGLLSTAGDLVRWQIALTNGRVVSPASFQQMIGSTVKTGQGDAAYGFGLLVDTLDGQRRISHTGGINGFNSSLTWLPDIGLRTAVISNSEALPADWLEGQIIHALTSNTPPPPLRTTPAPGAQAALRKLIESQADGTPDYAMMGPQLAEAVRTQLPQLQPLFRQWGPITAMTYIRTDLMGWDSYRVEFASGPPAIFSLVLYPDGRIALSNFRPAPASQ